MGLKHHSKYYATFYTSLTCYPTFIFISSHINGQFHGLYVNETEASQRESSPGIYVRDIT